MVAKVRKNKFQLQKNVFIFLRGDNRVILAVRLRSTLGQWILLIDRTAMHIFYILASYVYLTARKSQTHDF